MKQGRYGTLKGLTVTVAEYESYQEADNAAGKADAMLAEGNASLAYRGPLGEGREVLCELLETITGIERKTKDTGKKNAEGQPILAFDESEGEYASRVCATKNWEDLKALQADFDAACAKANDGKGLSVDIKRPERKPTAPKKLSKMYVEKATAIITQGKLDTFLANFAQPFQVAVGRPLTFTPSGDQAKDIDTLGWLCKEYIDAKNKQDVAALAG